MDALKKKICMLLSIMMTICFFVSCGDDDDPATDEIRDYFWEVKVVDKGHLTASEANSFARILDDTCAELEDYLIGINRSDAIYLHDKLIKAFRVLFSDEMTIPASWGTITFTVSLKLDDGETVKKNTITISKDNCSVK